MGTEIDEQKRGKRAAFNIKSFPPIPYKNISIAFKFFIIFSPHFINFSCTYHEFVIQLLQENCKIIKSNKIKYIR